MTPSTSPSVTSRDYTKTMSSAGKTSPTPTSATAPGGHQRHRPPMLNLGNQAVKTSPSHNPPSASLAGVNLSHLNTNTATTTTTVLGAPPSAIFSGLRTPKEVVLQDIALQCISPALPSFGTSVYDAMARSKTIQEEQRKLIAQRILDDDDTSRTANGTANGSNGSQSSADSTKSPRRGESSPSQRDLIFSENGDIVIEAVPTPTESRLKVDLIQQGSMKSSKRKAPPNSIELFPYSGGPSIHSAPLRRAPYSPHSLNAPPQYRRVNPNAVPQSATFKPVAHPRPVQHNYPVAPMTAVPVRHPARSGLYSWPQHGNAYQGRPLRPHAEEDDEDEDDEDDGRDPEDAALSDDEADPSSARKPVSSSKPARAADDDDEEDDEHMSDVEKRAVSEEDERSFERKKKRRMMAEGLGQVLSAAAAAGSGAATTSGDAKAAGKSGIIKDLRAEQLKKQRFLELCSELWDVIRS